MAVQFNWLYVGGGTALGKSGYGLGTYNDPWNPLDYYSNCFLDCGRDTVSGRADLAQIPQDWGGTMS